MAVLEDFYFHSADISDVFKRLNVDPKKGLAEKEFQERLKHHGHNVLEEGKNFRSLGIILRQIKSPLVFILIIAALFTLYLKEYTDFIVIIIAVLINTIVGYLQERQASDAFRKLKSSIKKYTVVLREGLERKIETSAIVPGDILILRGGDQIPADARIFEEKGLEIDESVLTGEWLNSKKSAGVVKARARITEQSNMIWMGTLAVAGWAKAVVSKTGKETEFGKIAGLLKEKKERMTQTQKNITGISRFLAILITVIVVTIFLLGVLRGEGLGDMFITAIAVAVATIPEGLPVAITVILALGMRSILKKGGLVRKLNAAETLGSCDIILTDKTGTLTEAKMRVSNIISPEQIFKKAVVKTADDFVKQKSYILKISILTSDAFIENPKEQPEKWIIRGKSMDRAIFEAGVEAGADPDKFLKIYKRSDFLPFDAERRFVASINKKYDFDGIFDFESDENAVYVSGAPEAILAISSKYAIGGNLEVLTAPAKKKIRNFYEDIAKEGIRVTALAFRGTSYNEFPRDNRDLFFNGLVFCGLMGFDDPIRESVGPSLLEARNAGVRTVMVTGDHKSTALAIAKKIGLLESGGVLTGEEMEKMSRKDLEDRIEQIDIFSRVLPRQKMDIVEAWQSKNKVVAMTGDGVNDAPALKRADIGVAIGSGTDVAREASDIVILNDSFSVIVAAIEQGRIITDNIRKVITYLLASGFTEVILVAGTLFLGYPLPVLPAQILWANIIQEGFMNFAYAFEPKEKDVMAKIPGKDGMPKKIINAEMKVLIFIIGIATDLFLLSLFFILYGMNYDLEKIRTIMFAGLSIDAIFFAFSLRSLRRPIWKINPFSNSYLILAFVLSLMFLAGALILPPVQSILRLVPISISEFLIILGLGILDLLAIETGKLIYIRKFNVKNKT